jgi:putative SOS response-associated peptidase YedK
MCGRFTLIADLDQIIQRFNIGFSIDANEYMYRYNIAPSQNVLSIVNDGHVNRLGFLKWGLVPSWAKDASIGYKMINARSETLVEKPSFKYPFKRRRCLIIADSFYEWKKEGKKKQPMRIRLKNDKLFAMAGLWERWNGSSGDEITSCTIITTKPNEFMKSIHDRMPVILSREDEKVWLDRSIDDTDLLNHLLAPYPTEKMEAYQVSTEVNSPHNESSNLIKDVEAKD